MQNPPPGQQAGPQSSIGLAPNVAAALSYIWIVGLILFFIEKTNNFIRFHAMQSVLYGVTWTVVMIVLAVLNAIIAIVGGVASAAAGDPGFISLIISLISLIIWLVIPLIYVGGLILGAVKAYQNTKFKFPVIGNMAEKIAGSQ
ncbi:MAG TPA: DUF4870 domain-containing protein [Pyrinomonadaceae bacterium]|nr:DUF4870 domain-containing protein [Pyrinomonadaceae bacterium]